jgi:hypothetical protein
MVWGEGLEGEKTKRDIICMCERGVTRKDSQGSYREDGRGA